MLQKNPKNLYNGTLSKYNLTSRGSHELVLLIGKRRYILPCIFNYCLL